MQQRCGYSLSLCHYDCAVSLCGSEGSAQTQKYDPSFEPLRALVDLLNRNTLDCSTVRMSQTQPQIKTIVTGRDCKPSRKADHPHTGTNTSHAQGIPFRLLTSVAMPADDPSWALVKSCFWFATTSAMVFPSVAALKLESSCV